ncbi:hypothetical protein BGX26_006318 [Mortierella sp. AD094]|nr:hypothetical protein BGX26_006318 [Mortierella sp. AD094]
MNAGTFQNTVPFVTPYGISPQDVPWLRDLITRNAVRLFNVRQLYDLTLSVAVGPNCSLHTAQLQLAPEGTPTLVAIKQYHRPADLTAEVHQLLIAPQSQYINPLIGIVQLGDHGLACLIVPYHPLGNLRRYIAEQRENLNALQQMQIIHDIVSGLEVLHQRGIHHMNLHSANILVSMQGIAILTDFGRANNRAEVGMPPKPTAEQERVRSLAVVFMAPEVLVSNSYSNRSDIYALGMVMFELLTGRVAFEKDLNQPGLSNRIMFGKQDEIPPNLKGSPGPAYETLIKECWKLSPGERPHLLGLKGRLERLMTESRQKAEALKLQHQATQLHQQQLYQQQQAHYMQSYQPDVVAPPTPPLQDFPQVDPALRAQSITARLAANSAAQAAASKASEPTIITTKIIVADPVRPRTESSSSSAPSDKAKATSPQKPVEAWTIGQSTTHSVMQRDAIPISTRALEITSGQLRSKATPSTDRNFAIPQNTISTSETTVAPAVVAPMHAQRTGSVIGAGSSPIQSPSATPSTPSLSVGGSDSSHGSSVSPAWPLPPNMSHFGQSTAFVSNTNAQSTSGSRAGSDNNIPIQNLNATGTSAASSSFYKPPPPQPVHLNDDDDYVTRAYANFSQGSTATSTVTPAPAPAPEPSPATYNRPTVLTTQELMAGAVTPFAQQSSMSPRSPASSMSMSPNSLFNPGRNTIVATSAEEQQLQYDSLSTFFNLNQLPKLPPSDGEERRSINSASTQVRVVGDNGNVNDTYISAARSQDQRYERVKSFVATIEPAVAEAPPVPSTISSQYQAQYQAQYQPQSQSPTTAVNGELPGEPILIIPAFPEPPSTLHNRRISNVDIRYRPAARQTARSQLRIQEEGGLVSSDDSGIKSPTSVTPGAVIAPQEAVSGASPVAPGLAARDSYIPIASSDDVPTGTPSTCIFSSARNGDLPELQHFLNQALSRFIPNGSSVSVGSSSRLSSQKGNSSIADILDELEPIERLPVLCCAAVARKNKYQALNMVLKAGANVEGKELRGGNTPLHLVCETAPPPVMEPKVVRYKQDEHGNRIRAESSVDLTDNKMSQLSLLDITSKVEGSGSMSDDDDFYNDEDDSEEKQAEALKKVDDQDEQEQQALERVQEDSESIFSISTGDGGLQNLSTRNQSALGGPYYQMKNHILMKGGLEDQIRLLVLAGSPIDTPNLRGETPLLLLLRFHDSVTALATLLRLGADPTHMVPFGPGINPPEVHVDPMTIPSPKHQKRASKALKALEKSSATKLHSVYLQLQSPSPNNDPNHILIMHGGALAQAAYYLRINCLRYLLEYEIECSDPTTIDRAIVACQQSEAARVNPPLVATQKRILQILEKDWKGESGQRRRARIAERTLNLKNKPKRPSVLLEALAVSSMPSSSSTHSFSSAPRETYLSPPPTPTHHQSYSSQTNVSASQIPIPTTHLYTVEGPSGPHIELISQHGFSVDAPVTRRQLSDQTVPAISTNGLYQSAANGSGVGVDQSQSTEFHDWRRSGDLKSPRLGQGGDSKGILNKFRNMAKRS